MSVWPEACRDRATLVINRKLVSIGGICDDVSMRECLSGSDSLLLSGIDCRGI